MDEFREATNIWIDKPNMCRDSDSPLIIAIKSSLSKRSERQRVRNSWLLTAKNLSIPYIFAVGSSVNKTLIREAVTEDNFYQDMIFGTFVDEYFNLTLKSLFILNWTMTRCPEKWLLVGDDDIVFKIEEILKLVIHSKYDPRAIYGWVCPKCQIRRMVNKEDKWYVPAWAYPYERFPDYTLGGYGYVLSPGVPEALARTALRPDVGPKLWIEDVFFTGIVRNIANISVVQADLTIWYEKSTDPLIVVICALFVLFIVFEFRTNLRRLVFKVIGSHRRQTFKYSSLQSIK
ncbi:Beta-1,3-galactosyltransferase 1 [Halotydeus destructor]|nr:Beta-1,3-galactosyltransferase 1 [Halotydeus destructor]